MKFSIFFLLIFFIPICHAEEEKPAYALNFCSREEDWTGQIILFDRDQILLTKNGIVTVEPDQIALYEYAFYAGNGKYCVNGPIAKIKLKTEAVSDIAIVEEEDQ